MLLLFSSFSGFFTCLGEQGQLYDDLKYGWLQGRQVSVGTIYLLEQYLFSQLNNNDEICAQFREMLVRTYAESMD